MTYLARKLKTLFVGIFIVMISASSANAQEEEKKPDRPVRNMFESNLLIDNQSAIVPVKGTFEFDIMHRFGTWQNGYDDFWGVFAPSNIRLGFTYVAVKKLQLGFGLTKQNHLLDFNIKYAILEQTRSGRVPLALSYYGNMAIDARDGSNFDTGTDRYSYFHQLMAARKFSDRFSLQGLFNFSHFNAVKAFTNDSGEVLPVRENDHLSFSILGRYKITDGTAFIFNYDRPISDHEQLDPEANLGLGLEFVTSSHAFQFFVGNYRGIVPQYNQALNQFSFGDNEILIGFNMTRLWNF